jgi:hypothetical protein
LFFKVLKEAQLRAARTEQACLDLRKQVAAMSISNRAPTRKGSRVPSSAFPSAASVTSLESAPISESSAIGDPEPECDGLDPATLAEITKLGKRFVYTGELFMDDLEAFRQPRPESISWIISSADRYKSRESIKEGIVAELYMTVPERLHDMMQNDSLVGRTVILSDFSSITI